MKFLPVVLLGDAEDTNNFLKYIYNTINIILYDYINLPIDFGSIDFLDSPLYRTLNKNIIKFSKDNPIVSVKMNIKPINGYHNVNILFNLCNMDNNLDNILLCDTIINLLNNKEYILDSLTNDLEYLFEDKLLVDRFIVLIEALNFTIKKEYINREHHNAPCIVFDLNFNFIEEYNVRPGGSVYETIYKRTKIGKNY